MPTLILMSQVFSLPIINSFSIGKRGPALPSFVKIRRLPNSEEDGLLNAKNADELEIFEVTANIFIAFFLFLQMR